jgi:transcriptional regulator with XRE-family HTH domain
MNGIQARLARQALKLTFHGAAELTGVSASTIQRIETEARGPYASQGVVKSTTIQQVQAAYEKAGISFIDDGEEGPGIRLRPKKRKPR